MSAQAARGPGTVVIGVGQSLRGDDALGLEAAQRVAARRPPGVLVLAHLGDAASLMECWRGAERVILVDAARGMGPPGTVRRLDLHAQALPGPPPPGSHAMGVREAVELARALGRLPRELIAYVVEGRAFDRARALSADAERALAGVVEAILAEAAPSGPPALTAAAATPRPAGCRRRGPRSGRRATRAGAAPPLS